MNRHQRAVQRKLENGRFVDQRISRLLEKIDTIRSQATALNVNLSDMPGNPNRNIHKMEDAVVQICEMEAAAEKELNRLLAIKKEVQSYIYQVQDYKGQIILEHRYLLDESWETIAKVMGYSARTVRRVHDRAIDQIRII